MIRSLTLLFLICSCQILPAQEPVKKLIGKYNAETNYFEQDSIQYWFREFQHGFSKFSKAGYFGIIDTSGNIILPMHYDEIFIFPDHFYSKFNDTILIFDHNGNPQNRLPDLSLLHYKYIYVPELDDHFKITGHGDNLLVISESYHHEINKHAYVDTTGKIILNFGKYKQSLPFQDGRARVSFNGYFGYIDRSGKEVIPLKYDRAGDFSEGLAWVKNQDGVGFIDVDGNTVIPFKYDWADNFNSGLAPVQKDGQYGYINKNGEEVIDLKFAKADIFVDGKARVALAGDYFFIDTAGNNLGKDVKQITYFNDNYFTSKEGDSVIFKNSTGDEIFRIKSNRDLYFHEGLAVFEQDKKYGYVDLTGEIIIKAQYDHAGKHYMGFASVSRDGKWGMINKQGKEVIPVEFYNKNLQFLKVSFPYAEKLVTEVYNGNKYGALDQKGDTIIDFKYDKLIAGTFFISSERDGKKGLFSITGKSILPEEYNKIHLDRKLIIGEKINNIEIFKRSGELIRRFEGSDLYINKDFIHFRQNNKPVLYDLKKNILLYPPVDYISRIDNDIVLIMKNRRHGHMDLTGTILYIPKYDMVEPFSEGLARVKLNGKYGYINNKGEEIIPIIYDDASVYIDDGIAMVKLNGKAGFIDRSGKLITPIEFDGANEFKEDRALIIVDNLYGFIDKKGTIVIEPKYQSATSFNYGVAEVFLYGRRYYINKKGEEVSRY